MHRAMLRELSITRFKSIRDQELSFGRVNLFIGGNGTGKSNLLEAIGLLSACLGRGLSDADIARKGLRLTPSELMKSSFKNEGLPKTLEFSAKFQHDVEYKVALRSSVKDPLLSVFSESCHLGKRRVFGRSNRGASAAGTSYSDRLDQNRGIWDQIRVTHDVPEHVWNEFDSFANFAIYTPQTDFLRGRQAGKIDNPPIGLHGEGLPEAASALLDLMARYRRKKSEQKSPEWKIVQTCLRLLWLPGWASTFGVHRSNPLLTSRDVVNRSAESVYFVDKFMHASRNQLSVYDSSEGTLFLLFAAILLADPRSPKSFALDNVDNALNPRLTRALVERIIEICSIADGEQTELGARQVFLTSHNPTALDAFDLFDDEQRVFVVERNDKGHTVARRVEPSKGMSREDWELLKGGRNLSQLWLDDEIPGALGSKVFL